MHVSVVRGTALETDHAGVIGWQSVRNGFIRDLHSRRWDTFATRRTASRCLCRGSILAQVDHNRVRRMIEGSTGRSVHSNTDQSPGDDVAGHRGPAAAAHTSSHSDRLGGVARRAGGHRERVLPWDFHHARALALHAVRQPNSSIRRGDVDRNVLIAPASDGPAAREQEGRCQGKKGRFYVRPLVECGEIVMALCEKMSNLGVRFNALSLWVSS